MTELNQIIYDTAYSYLGLREYPGAKNNPEVLKLYKEAGVPQKADQVPWCAAFVGAVLAQCGLKGTGSLSSRSYKKWGDNVPIHQARQGDVVVLWRVDRNSWQGHVGFFVAS